MICPFIERRYCPLTRPNAGNATAGSYLKSPSSSKSSKMGENKRVGDVTYRASYCCLARDRGLQKIMDAECVRGATTALAGANHHVVDAAKEGPEGRNQIWRSHDARTMICAAAAAGNTGDA